MCGLGILQSTVLEYRLEFYQMLKSELGESLVVCCGRHDSKPGQTTPDEAWAFATPLRNRFLCKKKLLWQDGVVKGLGDVPVVVVDPNMRFISTWILLFYRRFKGLPTIAWGHAKGRSRVGNFLRKYYYALFDGIIAYTESQRDELSKIHSQLPIWSAFNACLKAEDCVPACVASDEYTDFVFVGRLSRAKKPELLLNAFIAATECNRLPLSARLIFVGDDPDKERLECLARDSSCSERIIFHGSIHDVSRLREVYKRSIAAVSPGYVGLSVTQATGFGVPMLVAQDEPHSPEIEVCREGFNAVFFPSDDVDALANTLSKVYDERLAWMDARGAIADDTKGKYSFEKMRNTFLDVHRFYLMAVFNS